MTKQERLQAKCDRFNAHGKGTKVRYWLGSRNDRHGEGVTRSDAFVLGGHVAVVTIAGVGSCVGLFNVDVIESANGGK